MIYELCTKSEFKKTSVKFKAVFINNISSIIDELRVFRMLKVHVQILPHSATNWETIYSGGQKLLIINIQGPHIINISPIQTLLPM